MRSHRSARAVRGLALAFAAALLLAGLPGAAARAESRDATTVTLGWQIESSEAIVVAVALPAAATPPASDGDAHEASFRVERSIHGPLAADATLRLAYDSHGLGLPWKEGERHLLFVRRAAGDTSPAPLWVPVSGAFSVRALPEGSAEARFPDLAASLAETLATKEPAKLRALLVRWMEDADPGVAWSAATDFVRHEELHATLTDAERARILDAFRRQPIGKNTKGALAWAVAATRSPAAVTVLVESLVQPEGHRIRGPVAEALRRLDRPDAEAALVERLEGASAEQQIALLGALAVVGRAPGVPAVRPLLDAPEERVRVEAAAALGGMARNARAKDPAARLGLAEALSAHVLDAADATEARPEREVRARLWALAQLDEPAAFDTVRKAATSSALPEAVRTWAARLLAQPRQSLIL